MTNSEAAGDRPPFVEYRRHLAEHGAHQEVGMMTLAAFISTVESLGGRTIEPRNEWQSVPYAMYGVYQAQRDGVTQYALAEYVEGEVSVDWYLTLEHRMTARRYAVAGR